MSATRIIKKYANRRLYDTVESKYVTLAELQWLARSDTRFQVIDDKSGEDITRSILLQIILEQERGGTPVLSTDFLYRFIRFYGDAMQGFMGRYLEKSLDIFQEQQEVFRSLFASMLDRTPYGVLNDMTDRNLQQWRTLQEDFLSTYGLSFTRDGNGVVDGSSTKNSRDESAPPNRKGEPQ
jgi:polyhydroxyalkanoate synthesis repressor PhaR